MTNTWGLGLLWLAASPAAAQQIATSPGPSSVSVTVYRAPDRGAADPIRLGWLGGYALISETRTVTIPAGEADIRFEGVAGGILPESAIVSGLPDGVAEKNQDAFLLSPASLLDRSLGKRVHLRRTSRATGAVREEEAIVRTGAEGGVVLQTAAGYEALRCSGLPETVVYDRVPAGLSAKPTLSVRTQAARAATATVTLSYLAGGFDWQANYVGTLSADGTRMDLFAWVTLANGDETSFARAATQAVAGRVNREGEGPLPRAPGQPLQLTCYPLGTTTSDLPVQQGPGPPPPPPAAVEPMAMPVPVSVIGEEIIVTGSRIALKTLQEELGDLKLYRIPEPVTVAAMSQKQVVLLDKPGVRVAEVYRRRVLPAADAGPVAAARVLTTGNRVAQGLGLPLPAGPIALFATFAGRQVLLGEGAMDDRAVGEDVEIEIAAAAGVFTQQTTRPFTGKRTEFLLNVTNDRAVPVVFEAEFGNEILPAAGTGPLRDRRRGRPLWRVTVPANGRAALRYFLKD